MLHFCFPGHFCAQRWNPPGKIHDDAPYNFKWTNSLLRYPLYMNLCRLVDINVWCSTLFKAFASLFPFKHWLKEPVPEALMPVALFRKLRTVLITEHPSYPVQDNYPSLGQKQKETSQNTQLASILTVFFLVTTANYFVLGHLFHWCLLKTYFHVNTKQKKQ